MQAGTLLMLNGTTSSGKSSILAELQARLDGPFLDAGIDKFIFMLPGRYLEKPLWDEVLGKASSAGPLGHTLFSGMHHALAALLRQGNHVLADHVLVEQAWVRECATLFAELPAHLIGVRCALAVVEQRERDRRDRTLGQARRQFDLAHRHAIYDFEVDTEQTSAVDCAAAIAAYLASGRPPSAFRQLRDNLVVG
jgi:chloramphenicol 3-O phosphotransferase